MKSPKIVSHSEWLVARKALLAKEKEFTRARDALSAARRALPWEKVETDYVFEGQNGPLTLVQLFAGKSQLIVYHFMFGPDWEAGCKSCSFWADNFARIGVHLRHRDANLALVSRAPYARLADYQKRMGWEALTWVSSLGNSFNFDYAVSFTKEELETETKNYNFGTRKFGMEEAPGISVFACEGDAIFHTYSTYSRGLDMLNGAYHLLDLLPKGRDEQGLSYGMEWLRRRDEYES